MRVEVLNTGTELLLGHVINTHVKFFAEELFPLGLRIQRQVTVPDGVAIRDALLETFGRADIVLITGGLGPTTDDLTRDIVADLLGVALVHDEEIMRAISARFNRRGLAMSERVGRQALRPKEATVLANHHGTAPGLYLPPQTASRSPHLFLLPGPPRELKPMFAESVVPILRGLLPETARAEMRSYRIAGLGESAVEELVGEPLLALGLELGYCARPGEVDLRIIGETGVLQVADGIIRAQLDRHIVSQDQSALETVVVQLLTARKQTVATAESCTGGYLAHRLTNVPGSSAVFLEGFVTYANEAKMRALGVDAAALNEHGAVSEPVVRAMAAGAKRVAQTDYALATTGIAGPGGGSDAKPLGTVFIALAKPDGETSIEKHRFATDRETFKDLTTQAALDLLRRALLS
ncbi:MAG TPA: competence/damage-inducible protein A [Chthoniobacteraceae bacterium]|jgi:nicotinamide-nucleotide amidase|nr:competence/damage-inducible protein A [Chthoniobacteraceae bacterium]